MVGHLKISPSASGFKLNWFNVHNRYLQFIVSDIWKFYNNEQCSDYFNNVFCPVGDNGVATRSCSKTLKLPFRKSKLRIQNLSHVGPSTCNKPLNNLKTTTSVCCFKHVGIPLEESRWSTQTAELRNNSDCS